MSTKRLRLFYDMKMHDSGEKLYTWIIFDPSVGLKTNYWQRFKLNKGEINVENFIVKVKMIFFLNITEVPEYTFFGNLCFKENLKIEILAIICLLDHGISNRFAGDLDLPGYPGASGFSQ